MDNMAFIYQPHFKTGCFRVSKMHQCKSNAGEKNFIVVTCSEHYNGVYTYPAELTKEFSTWKNGRIACYEVPIDVCTKIVEDLKTLKNPVLIESIKKQQQEWFNSEVENRNYEYKNGKPEWMI